MTHKIIGYENGTISCCEKQQNCENCLENECSKCCRAYFDEIKNFCDSDEIDGIKIDYKTGNIKCSGYCGYFQLSDGTEVYILPKIDKEDFDNGVRIFKNLVENAYHINNVKTGTSTSTNFDKNDLFVEILIRLFCNFMENLFKKGVKKFYTPQEDNFPYLKGKIKFSEHIKKNITSREKFYVEYDEFTDDIADNRILKSACKYLLQKINGFKDNEQKNLLREENKKLLRRYLQEFADIDECKNLEKDFSKIQPNRLYQHYDKPLLFAEAFLHKKNYWIEKGRKKFPAILFSLPDLFEDYIENLLDEFKKDLKFDFKPQHSRNYLLTENIPQKPDMFNTKMDFVLWNKNGTKAIIMDAKYKLINLCKEINQSKTDEEEKFEKNYHYNPTNISQHDLYQVFTYSEIIKKRNPNIEEVEIALLYPKSKNFENKKTYYYFNGTKLTFIPIDICGENDSEPDNEILKTYISEHLKTTP